MLVRNLTALAAAAALTFGALALGGYVISTHIEPSMEPGDRSLLVDDEEAAEAAGEADDDDDLDDSADSESGGAESDGDNADDSESDDTESDDSESDDDGPTTTESVIEPIDLDDA